MLGALTACAPKDEGVGAPASGAPQGVSTTSPKTETAAEDEPSTANSAAKALDLSMPENFFPENNYDSEKIQSEKFDASGLFNKDDEKTLSVTVTPSLEAGEQPHSLPKLDGGSVSVEINTK